MSCLLISQDGGVVTARLNLPELRNPISEPEMIEAIESLCESINQDPTVSVLILTGEGKGFSSGGNVQHMKEKSGMFAGDPNELAENYRQGIQRIPKAIFALDVPVIAAVNGAAVGAGCDLAMMADIRIASARACFAESFVKLGIIPGDGGAWFLPKVVGYARAAEMAFTGDMISAEQALAWGMVSKVVEHDDLMDEALVLAKRIASNPPQAVRETKKLMRLARAASLDELLDESARVQSHLHQTEDHIEAVNAFLEKRLPVFKGK
ncbi:crotonase/enoyl-CoA hydratase family protein [Litoribrevibacter albus]|uniref:Enoyl-CoA hydratase n=1 Tax=Litoribrevibacter albus TaxID=1473156 RepID=A0AA37W918_9GAMM|nr:crotonase/enoyl-CoA hydratase family protein [Litoribrevibacter albus]GLQ32669.1 enoyl-CoA hydratase [Litoribrevibacter albus]